MTKAPAAPQPPRRMVTCPTCGGDSVYAADNPFRPFCSERCKNVDFGAWATESYRLAARPSPTENSEDLDPQMPPRDAGAS